MQTGTSCELIVYKPGLLHVYLAQNNNAYNNNNNDGEEIEPGS